MSKNLPDIKRENILLRIKRFFSKLSYQESKNIKVEKIIDKKENFFEKEREKSKRYEYLLELQKKFEDGEITENEITSKDGEELKKIYKDQIEILKAKISKIESQL